MIFVFFESGVRLQTNVSPFRSGGTEVSTDYRYSDLEVTQPLHPLLLLSHDWELGPPSVWLAGITGEVGGETPTVARTAGGWRRRVCQRRLTTRPCTSRVELAQGFVPWRSFLPW